MYQRNPKLLTVNTRNVPYSPNDMMQCSGGVYASFARHVNHVSKKSEVVNRKYEERPLFPRERKHEQRCEEDYRLL
jgi:hypothetical protein